MMLIDHVHSLGGIAHGFSETVYFEGDRLPLAGWSVVRAKALLKDSWHIPYFAEAIVSGRRVPAHHLLQPDDWLGFSQRFGCKAGNDRQSEKEMAESLIFAYPELLEMVAWVKALDLSTDRSLDVMVGLVAHWAEERFGPPDKSIMATLEEIVARLKRIESPRVPRTQREMDIVQALGNARMTGEELAAKAGYEFDGYFKGILASMVKRGMICNKRPGYFLPASAKSGLTKD